MAKLDLPLRRVADKIIATFGTDAEIIRRVPGAYSSTDGKRHKAEFVTAVKGVFDKYNRGEIDDQVHVGDRKFIIAGKAMDYAPKPGDQMRIEGREYRIEGAEGTMSGTEAAIWTLQLRGTSA